LPEFVDANTDSTRKFDYFGDWVLLRRLRTSRALLQGRDQELADQFLYDFKRDE
jgi:hypothetical protein